MRRKLFAPSLVFLASVLLGFADGFREPLELSGGRTWDRDQDANDRYDRVCNWGQVAGWLARPWLWRERPQPWEWWFGGV